MNTKILLIFFAGINIVCAIKDLCGTCYNNPKGNWCCGKINVDCCQNGCKESLFRIDCA